MGGRFQESTHKGGNMNLRYPCFMLHISRLRSESPRIGVRYAIHSFLTPIRRGFTSYLLPVVLCFLVVLNGCGGAATNFQLSPADAEKLNPILAELQLSYDLTSTLRILQLIVTIEEEGKKEEVRESLWYKKSETDGDLLHIQAMGPLNEPRVVVIAARNQFLLYLINEEEVIFEPLEDQVLQEIFGVDLRVSDVRSAIFANPFLDGRTHELSLAYSGAKYVVTRPGIAAGQIEQITIFVRDAEPQVNDWEVRDATGTTIQRAKFSDYREVGGISRPHKIEIERPIEKTQVVLKIIKPEINLDINDSKFEFERFLKEGIKRRSLGK